MAHRVVLTLIRHLPTAGNIKRQYIGWTDESIVKSESNELPWQPSVVYGSDLRRCQESAGLYFPKAIYQSDNRFRESNFGDWEGKTYELLKRDSAYRSWINSPYRCQPPNGESLADVKARVLQAIYDLPCGEEEYFIVTHGGPIRILLTEFDPEKRDFWSWTIPHQSVWQLQWDCEKDFREGKRCASLSAVPITGNELT
ncbi:histidine phosphatase family protein [Sporosarcina pasteurii]|uniref:Phosphoglyceromutase n=1 Tax=Sporosarcina pasteurii TaxID=1474 RepID=A0A380BCL4_SPOPA|nr:histidine phosphatase family protein [Sporosarcina pasteurii]MDS9472311.1 histidine phosphatase family protein [Sporosarcina pasteurii]QBQ06291.1 histidine phosphatase family protein [Sporosarcina pasteurii]SUI99067.1 Phosphoglyceromutase [Sporosarcina pasteurii]